MQSHNTSFNGIAFNEIKTILLSACEELCNRALRYDESSRQAFARLEGKVLNIQTSVEIPFAPIDISFYIQFCENGLLFSGMENGEQEVDAEICASSFHLLTNLISQKGLLEGKVFITGDRALVSEVQSILFNLDLDWEEPLSRVTGGIVAHEVGRFAQDARSFLKGSGGFLNDLFDRGIFENIRPSSPASRSRSSESNEEEFAAFKNDIRELEALQQGISSRLSKLPTTP
jgi:ubiquinone biosynthesis protein UbiJ